MVISLNHTLSLSIYHIDAPGYLSICLFLYFIAHATTGNEQEQQQNLFDIVGFLIWPHRLTPLPTQLNKNPIEVVFSLELKRNRLSTKLINESFVEAWQYLYKHLCILMMFACVCVCLPVYPIKTCNWALQSKWKRVKRTNWCHQLMTTFWLWNHFRAKISCEYKSALQKKKNK